MESLTTFLRLGYRIMRLSRRRGLVIGLLGCHPWSKLKALILKAEPSSDDPIGELNVAFGGAVTHPDLEGIIETLPNVKLGITISLQKDVIGLGKVDRLSKDRLDFDADISILGLSKSIVAKPNLS